LALAPISLQHGDGPAVRRDLLPWAMLALAWIAYAYFGLVVGALPALIGTIEDDLGLSGTQAGVLLGAFPLMYIVSAMATGKLADRLGVKRTAVAGITVLAISALARGPADTFPLVLGATALVGLGGPVVSTVLPKLVGQWFEGGRRTLATGIYTTGPAVGAGIALAGNEALLDAAGSWHRVFVLYGLVGFAVALAWALLAREPRASADAGAAPGRGASVWRSADVWCVVVVGSRCSRWVKASAAGCPRSCKTRGSAPARRTCSLQASACAPSSARSSCRSSSAAAARRGARARSSPACSWRPARSVP
jgi:cyanate permease